QETQSASIAYSNIDFNLTSAGDTSLYVNTIEDFTLFLSQTATDPSITYDVVFSLGTGTAGNGNITDNGGAALTLGTSYPLAIGSTGFNFEGTAVGLVNVVATVTDSNGVVHSTTIAMDVQDISYTFTAAAQNNTIGAGGSTAINMSIIEDLFSGADYQLKYVMVSGTGSVTNNGTPLNTNTFYNVTTGNFAWTFEAGSAGTTELLFTAVNTTTGEEQTQTVTITVDNAPACQFNFTAIASENSAIVGEDVAINFNVNSTVPGTNYTMIYTTSESGSLDYNGTTYTPGQVINLGSNPSSFVATYAGSTQGAHDLDFTITCDGGSQETESFSILYNTTDFTLSTVGDGTLLVNEIKNFFAIITQAENDPSITYQVQFSIESGSTGYGEVYQGNTNLDYGVYHNISVGNTNYTFKGISIGDVTLNVEVTDSNGVTHSSNIDFVIENIEFTFSATPQDGSIILGETTNIFFDINETTASGTNYEIKYVITSSETGELLNAATTINPNNYIPISVGGSSWEFNSIEVGNINIEFTVINLSTLQEETDSVTIEVNEPVIPTFNFTAIPEENSEQIENCVNINFNLTEIDGSSAPYTLIFITDQSGSLNYNGNTYSQGQPIPFVPGTSVGCYTGNNVEEHNITFTVTNSNESPISEDSDIVIDFTPLNDFNVSSQSSSDNINVNSTTNIDLTITELVGNSNYTFAFTNTGNGNLIYNGNLINEGQPYVISPGNHSLEYTPSNTGVHEIIFYVTNDNTTPITKSTTEIITVDNLNIFVNPTYIQLEEGDIQSISINNYETSPGWTLSLENSDAIQSGEFYDYNPSPPIYPEIPYNSNSTSIPYGDTTLYFKATSSTDMIVNFHFSNGSEEITIPVQIVVIPKFTNDIVGLFQKQGVILGSSGCSNRSELDIAYVLTESDFLATNQTLDKIYITSSVGSGNVIEQNLNFSNTVTTNTYNTYGGSPGLQSGLVTNNAHVVFNTLNMSGNKPKCTPFVTAADGCNTYAQDIDNKTVGAYDMFNPAPFNTVGNVNVFYIKFVTTDGKESYWKSVVIPNYDNHYSL
ncbi:hypothetical protein FHS04_002835, partial [Mesoflavibacter sabulilitoris]|uniref:hypothetical protein n=1 Tax=Mesoflavibacter zeaxanthinifaciens TaxID=393060 RepID=UPI00160F2460